MAITLVTSWGGKDSNAYIDLTEASSYILTYILDDTSIWTSSSTDTQAKAILRATVDIDNSYVYHGIKYYPWQNLQFPRKLEHDILVYTHIDTSLRTDYYRLQKLRVKNACAEQAYFLLKKYNKGEQIHDERISQGILSVSESAGPVSESVSYSPTGAGSFLKLSPVAYGYLKYYITSPKLVRGGAFDVYWR